MWIFKILPKSEHLWTFHGDIWGPKQNLGLIGLAVLTVISVNYGWFFQCKSIFEFSFEGTRPSAFHEVKWDKKFDRKKCIYMGTRLSVSIVNIFSLYVLLKQYQKSLHIYKFLFVDFQHFLKIEFSWRLYFELLIIHKPSLKTWFHTKFGPNRFSRFDIYWIQTNRHPDWQTSI